MTSRTVKLKEPSVVRTYDKDGFRRRAACICVNDDETMILLVTSRKDNNQWIVPGGGVEPEEIETNAALREVREEAGVNGTLGRCLGVFENADRGHRTSVFVMVVTEELDDWDESRTFGRQRRWFTIENAVSVLHKPLQSNYVRLLLPPDHHFHIKPPHPHVAPIHPHPPSENCCSQSILSSTNIKLKDNSEMNPSTSDNSSPANSSISSVPDRVIDKGSSNSSCSSSVKNSSSAVKNGSSAVKNVDSNVDVSQSQELIDKSNEDETTSPQIINSNDDLSCSSSKNASSLDSPAEEDN